MKKVMRIAAMFAAAGMMCAAMTVQPASAQTWTLVGEETESFVQDMNPVDDMSRMRSWLRPLSQRIPKPKSPSKAKSTLTLTSTATSPEMM